MKTLILNASLKKTGTTFLHNFFEINQKNIPGLIVPPIKEWYFIPRVPPLASRNNIPLQHSLGESAEKMYSNESNAKNKEFLRRVANRPSGFFMSIPEIVDRISYILAAFDDNAIIAINDPNFLHDCYLLAYLGMGDLLRCLGELFKVKLFCVHRDFSSFQVSFAKMRFALDGMDQRGRETPVGNLMLVPALLDRCDVADFPVYDMSLVTTRTSAFVKDLFFAHGIADLRGISMIKPENPNPSATTDYSLISDHLNQLETRWCHFDNPCGIHEKKRIMSSNYSRALKDMFASWVC